MIEKNKKNNNKNKKRSLARSLTHPTLTFHSYLQEGVHGYLLKCVGREREKAFAFRALGLMVFVLKDRMDLQPVLNIVRSNLPTGKEPSGKSV